MSTVDGAESVLNLVQEYGKCDNMADRLLSLDPLYTAWNNDIEALRVSMGPMTNILHEAYEESAALVLWRAIMDHRRKKQDTSDMAMAFLAFANDKHFDVVAKMAYGEMVPWNERDAHMATGMPLVMAFYGKEEKSRTKVVLDAIIDQVVGVANRHGVIAGRLLDQVLPYYSNQELVSKDGGGRLEPWVWYWANSCYDRLNNRPCSVQALEHLVAWGIDVDAVNQDGHTLLEWASFKAGNNPNEPLYEHIVQQLLIHGANWQKVMETGTDTQRGVLERQAAIRSHKLQEVAQATDRTAAGTPKHTPKM